MIRTAFKYIDLLYFVINLFASGYFASNLLLFVPQLEFDYIVLAAYIGFPLFVTLAGIVTHLLKMKITFYSIILNIYWLLATYVTIFEVGIKSSSFLFAIVMFTLAIADFCYLIFRWAKTE